MIAKYPFLSLWKKNGLKKFPPIPPQPLIDHLIAGYLEPVSKVTRTDKPSWDTEFEIRLRQRQDEIKRDIMEKYPLSFPKLQTLLSAADYKVKRGLTPLIIEFFFKEIQKIISDDFLKWGLLVSEARIKLFRGADREKTLRELGHKVLPSKRGGASLLSGEQLRILKNVYIEMQEAIREARRILELNINRPDPDETRHYNWKGFKKICKWANTIFDQEEFKQIISEKKPADVSADIIVQRLGRVLQTNITSGRSLQNRLQNIKPIVRHN